MPAATSVVFFREYVKDILHTHTLCAFDIRPDRMLYDAERDLLATAKLLIIRIYSKFR